MSPCVPSLSVPTWFYAWPTAEVAVMGSEGAVNIIFKNDIEKDEDKEALRQQILGEYAAEFATPYQAAERGFVDDVIEPHTTRQCIIDAFFMLEGKREKRPAKRAFCKMCSLPRSVQAKPSDH